MNSDSDSLYPCETSRVLRYLHTGTLDFTTDAHTRDLADDCSKALEEDYCTDEAIHDAMKFNQNCRDAAKTGQSYERLAMSQADMHALALDTFSYYLLGLKTLPSSHNIQQFRRDHYMALHIISRIIESGRRAEHGLPQPEPTAQRVLLDRLHAIYLLLRTDPGQDSPLLEMYIGDFLTRGGKEDFHTRMDTAVRVIYEKSPATFAPLSDVEAATAISENDGLLDYYFHASTPKQVSIDGQRELENRGYLSVVLRAVQTLRG